MVAALVLVGLVPAAGRARSTDVLPLPDPVPRAACGDKDRTETMLQGETPQADIDSGRSAQGYECNMKLVGGTAVNGSGVLQMTWYGDCGYGMTNGNTQLAVFDVSNPTKPTVDAVIQDPVGTTHEGIHANAARGILVLPEGDAFPSALGHTARLAVYDLRPDCRSPKLLGIVDTGYMPFGIHSGALSPDGNTYYAADMWGGPCFVAIDLSDLSNLSQAGPIATYAPNTPS